MRCTQALLRPNTCFSGLGHMCSVLEVVLQDFRSQRRTDSLTWRSDRADYFTAANDFSSCKPGDFRREHEIDLQLSVGRKNFFTLEQQAGSADVLGSALQPALLAQ